MIFKLPWTELTLTHPETKKIWNIKVHGKIISSCLNHGKLIEKQKNAQQIRQFNKLW